MVNPYPKIEVHLTRRELTVVAVAVGRYARHRIGVIRRRGKCSAVDAAEISDLQDLVAEFNRLCTEVRND